MSLEIEHKYLVESSGYKDLADSSDRITQGYLSRVKERTVRVRTIGNRGFLTVKGRNECDSRLEFEYEIPFGDALQLLDLCEKPVIDKTRYIVPFEGYVWEVDEFHGSLEGLVLAEIELKVSHYNYRLPSFVGEEVTGNPKYYNSNLISGSQIKNIPSEEV